MSRQARRSAGEDADRDDDRDHALPPGKRARTDGLSPRPSPDGAAAPPRRGRSAAHGSGPAADDVDSGSPAVVGGLAEAFDLLASPASPALPTASAPGAATIDEPVPGTTGPGFIDTDDGANIRTRPAELAGSQVLTAAPLPPATRVFVTGRHPQTAAWWYVTAFLPDVIVRGYVQGLRVTTDLPEPTARLYQIRSGDTAERLAVQEFAAAVRDGHDLRYYENVLLYINRRAGRAGVRGSYQDPGVLGGGANNVQLEAGRRIWLVSPAYARALEGVVPDGSRTDGAVAKAKRFAGHIDDILRSVTDAPSHLAAVAGEHAQAIRDHMVEIVGIIAGFVMAEALSAFLAATPTGVGQLAAVTIQLGLAAFGAAGMAVAGLQALEHATRWLTLAWTARGNEDRIAAASRELVRMLVALAMAALAYTGVKGNLGKAAALGDAMPPILPAFAVAEGVEVGGAGVAVKAGAPEPYAPVGTGMAMSADGDGDGIQSARTSGAPAVRPPARRHRADKVDQGTVAKNLNTVIEPGVDVAADVAAIRTGRAAHIDGHYVVNGRTYGVHDGTLYPISGPGFHTLNRGAFQALGVLNKLGNTPQAHAILARMKNVGAAETDAALAVWRLLQ